MRVLILSQSRSGSTHLASWLGSETDTPVMSQPFNPNVHTEEELDEQLEWLDSDRDLILRFVDNLFLRSTRISDVEWLISRFDKVIGLTRNNSHACAYNKLIADMAMDWDNTPLNIPIDNDIVEKNSNLMKSFYQNAETNKIFIRNQDIFQITFEEIYDQKDISKLTEYLGIEPKSPESLFIY